MTERDDLHLRGARDRVFDLLRHFGKTAPLRDTPVEQGGLVVPFDTPVDVVVDPGQLDVRYLLRDRDGQVVSGSTHSLGTSGPTALTTPNITDDVTYLVLGRKTQPNAREAFLHDQAAIKVGLDTTIAARILAPTLDPNVAVAADDAAPRVIDHGTAVSVEVDESQVGIDYDVVVTADEGATWAVRSTAPVRGDSATIVIETLPFDEDDVVRVRATRHFDPDEDRDDQTAILDIMLPLAVRANTDLDVTFVDGIVDHEANATLTVRGTQSTATYEVRSRRLSWFDFAPSGESGPVVTVPVPEAPDLMVRWPPAGAAPGAPFANEGSAQVGTGGDLTFAVAAPDDTVAVVVATKLHFGGQTTVELVRPGFVLVRPDPGRELTASVSLRDGDVSGAMRVAGGQPGVRYHFTAPGPVLPAYFPSGPPDAAGVERGINTLRVGYDFVVRRNAEILDPLIELRGLRTLPIELEVRAVKATTLVGVPMTRSITIDAEPPVTLEHENVGVGERARVVVTDSVEGETYQPFVGEEPMRQVRHGTGGELVFRSEPLDVDTSIDVRVTVPATDDRHSVEKSIALDVTVWPAVSAFVVAPPLDIDSTSDTSPRLVDHGATPSLVVSESMLGVSYGVIELTGDTSTEVSRERISGTGAVLTVPLRELHEDIDLRLEVSKFVRVGNVVEVRRYVTGPAMHVAVRADSDLPVGTGDGVVDYMASATLTVGSSRSTAAYTAHTRRLSDHEFFPDANAATFLTALGDSQVWVRAPWGDLRDLPDGFAPAAGPIAGNGGDLLLDLAPRDHDALVVVTATKTHVGGRTSTVALDRVVVSFVRPNPDPSLTLTASVIGSRIGRVMVSGGQFRVLYFLRNGERGVEHDLPAYAHDPERGVDRLRVGVDLIPVRNHPSGGPPDPIVMLSRRPQIPARIVVRAEQARSGASVALTRHAVVPELPEIQLVENPVPLGSAVRVVISSTTPGDGYQLMAGGVPVAGVTEGDGNDVELVTGALDGDTVVDVHVSRADDESIPVVRVVSFEVRVE